MTNFLGESMTLYQFFETIKFPATLWIILFVLIFFKIGEIEKND